MRARARALLPAYAASARQLTNTYLLLNARARPRPSNSSVTPQAFHDAARALLDAVRGGAAADLPTGSLLSARANTFAAAAKEASIEACPASCVNLGSFHAVFEAPRPCLCVEGAPALLAAATGTWKVRARARERAGWLCCTPHFALARSLVRL